MRKNVKKKFTEDHQTLKASSSYFRYVQVWKRTPCEENRDQWTQTLKCTVGKAQYNKSTLHSTNYPAHSYRTVQFWIFRARHTSTVLESEDISSEKGLRIDDERFNVEDLWLMRVYLVEDFEFWIENYVLRFEDLGLWIFDWGLRINIWVVSIDDLGLWIAV